MPNDSVFGEGQTGPTDNRPQEESLVDQLVGEGKKFATIEDLAKGKLAADSHIDNLESQHKELTAELEKRLTAEEQVEKMLKDRQNQEGQEKPKEEGETAPSISEDKIAELVRETVAQDKTEAQAQANEDAVNTRLQEAYGEKAKERLEAKAKELSVSVNFLKDVARKSPSAFYSTIGLEPQKSSAPRHTTGTIDTSQLENQPVGGSGPTPGTYKWYNEMRKSDPKGYWTATVQKQLFADRKEKGQDFYK